MSPRLDISGPERANGTRIAITMGAIVLGFVLVLWAASALLGQLFAEPALVPPAKTSVATATPEPAISAEETEPPDLVAEPEPSATAPPVAPAVPVAAAPKPVAPASLGVVVIDPGHQAKGDPALEPIGPGATEKKPRVMTGTSGVATRRAESEVVLEIALKLKAQLEARGAKVVMVRTTQNVNISNAERARIGNDAKADLVIRLHCDGSTDRTRTGLSTLVPGPNQWTGPIVAESARAAGFVHRSVIASTGAVDRGIVRRTDLSGFNWSTRPTLLVEMGFMSNAEEDRRLSSPEYQARIVDGIADGAQAYLQSR